MILIECSRCAGSGKVTHMHVKMGVCFKCKGTGKQKKLKRVRVLDRWFYVKDGSGNMHHAKTIEQAESIAMELDSFRCVQEPLCKIIPRSSYHYELVEE